MPLRFRFRPKPKTTVPLKPRVPASAPANAATRGERNVRGVTGAEKAALAKTAVKGAAAVGGLALVGYGTKTGVDALAGFTRERADLRRAERDAQRQESFGIDTDGDGAADSHVFFDPSGKFVSFGEEPTATGDERTPAGAQGAIKETRKLALVAGVVGVSALGIYVAWKSGLLKASSKARGKGAAA